MPNKKFLITLFISLLIGLWYYSKSASKSQLNSPLINPQITPPTIATPANINASETSVTLLPEPSESAPADIKSSNQDTVELKPGDELAPSLSNTKTNPESTVEEQAAESSPILSIINPPHIPAQVTEILRDSLRNALAGNIEYAALLSIEAAEQLPSNKAFTAQMYSMAGRYYEQLQFNQSAIAQYRLALTYVDKHPVSYNALRRLDREFARQQPPLVEAAKNQPSDKQLSN